MSDGITGMDRPAEKWAAINTAVKIIDSRIRILSMLSMAAEFDGNEEVMKKRDGCIALVLRDLNNMSALVNNELRHHGITIAED